MGQWLYFTDEEVKGLKKSLVDRADIGRRLSGVPWRLTSTTKGEHVKASAHYSGEAIDVGHKGDIILAQRIAYGAGRAGFVRVGFYDRHIHLDIASHLPQVQWEGLSK